MQAPYFSIDTGTITCYSLMIAGHRKEDKMAEFEVYASLEGETDVEVFFKKMTHKIAILPGEGIGKDLRAKGDGR